MDWVRDGRVSLILVIAIGAVAIFGSALAVLTSSAFDNAYKDYQTSRAYDETHRQFEQRCAGLKGEEIFGCLKDQVESAREPSRAEEDVQAQKQMARWALWMLVVTGVIGFGTVFVTAVGVYWVKETLVVTRKAMLDTRAIGEAQVRAYISSPDVRARLETRDGGQWFLIEAFLSNSGNSPAIFPSVSCFVSQRDAVLNMRHIRLERDITAGEKDFLFLRQGHPIGMQADRSDLIFEGVIRYHTVFGGPEKSTSFRLRLRRTQDGDGPYDVSFDQSAGDGLATTQYRD